MAINPMIRILDKQLITMLETCNTGDRERDHANADRIIVKFLRDIGMSKSADWYADHTKHEWWYA